MEKIDSRELKDLLNSTTRKIESAKNNIEINTIVENVLTSLMGSEHASLWAFDDTKARLLRERSDKSVRELSMLDQRGILTKCFLTLSGGIYNYIASEKEYVPATDNPDEIRLKSKIIVPLLDDERLLGMVTCYSSVQRIKNFDEDDMELLETMTPFLINVIYRMHPEMKAYASDKVYMSERLQKESRNIVEKVEEIQHVQQVQPTTEANDATMNFLANTVHDIRTPANSLSGFLELLEGQINDQRLLQYIHNAKESAQFINELTSSILDRISSQRERTKSKPAKVNTVKFFADIVGIFSANMFNKEIDFNVYIDPLMVKEISVENIKLKRIILNLIGNAYKFTPTHKTIDFSVLYETSTKRLHVSIKDTGIGIAKEKQTEIFEAFKQAEDNTHLNFGGTGLGLSISAQFVRDLGGELKLESKLGAGSTFFFDIPVNVIDKAPALQPVSSAKIHVGILLDNKNVFSGKNLMRHLNRMGIPKKDVSAVKSMSQFPAQMTHLICFQDKLNEKVIAYAKEKNVELLVVEESLLSLANEENSHYNIISQYGYYANTLHSFVSSKKEMKVLVVDDDRINIELIKAILEEEFCKIESAQDGDMALELLKNAVKNNDPYSLVYLDKYMPKATGIEVISKFRKFEKAKGLNPIFAVSISGDPVVDSEELAMFNTYVGKPFNKKEIKETLLLATGKK